MRCVNKAHHSLGIPFRLTQLCQFHLPLLPYRKALRHPNQSLLSLCALPPMNMFAQAVLPTEQFPLLCPLFISILPKIQSWGQKPTSLYLFREELSQLPLLMPCLDTYKHTLPKPLICLSSDSP